MKIVQRIVNNLISENIFPLKVRILRQNGWWYLGVTNLCQNKSFLQFDLLHLLIFLIGMTSLNSTNYPILNVQDMF